MIGACAGVATALEGLDDDHAAAAATIRPTPAAVPNAEISHVNQETADELPGRPCHGAAKWREGMPDPGYAVPAASRGKIKRAVILVTAERRRGMLGIISSSSRA
jgi:hypothetical protein